MSSLSEIDYLTNLVIDNWERAFHIEKVSDREIKIHLEFEKESDIDNIWEFLPMRLDKYIVAVYKVPIGYIDVFVRSKIKI